MTLMKLALCINGTEGVNSKSKCSLNLNILYSRKSAGNFPGGALVKNPPANAGDRGSIPGLGRSHMPQSN